MTFIFLGEIWYFHIYTKILKNQDPEVRVLQAKHSSLFFFAGGGGEAMG